MALSFLYHAAAPRGETGEKRYKEIHLDQFKLSAAIKYFSDCSISEWAVSKRRIQPTLSGYLGRTLLSFIVRK